MYQEILVRFLLAALWGGLVGAEREYHSKSAGFRTMIMISVGSCFFCMMSPLIGGPGNPDRIASNIVTGIGFLGAGVIFRGEGRLNGITTAATIWAVAAVGMGIGAGYYFASACASLLILAVLVIMQYLERVIDNANQSIAYTIQCTYDADKKSYFETLFKQHGLRCRQSKEIKEGNRLLIIWEAQGQAKHHKAFVAAIEQDDMAEKLEF